MKHAKLMVTGLLLSTVLTGCLGKEARQVSGNFCSPKAFRTVFMNNANLAGLYAEQEAEDVVSRMGKPASVSNFRMKDGGVVTALFYQINIEQPCRGFEGPYKYEPVFISGGELIGVGQRYFVQQIRPNMESRMFNAFAYNGGRGVSRYQGGFQERF